MKIKWQLASRGTIAAWIVGAVSVAIAMAIGMSRDTTFTPHVRFMTVTATPDADVDTEFVFSPRREVAACERLVASMSHALTAACRQCRVTVAECLPHPGSSLRLLMSEKPIDIPSIRMREGVAAFSSASAEAALVACRESESVSRKQGQEVMCYPPGVARPLMKLAQPAVHTDRLWFALLFMTIAGFVSGLACWLVLRFEHLHSHLTHDNDVGPQKFHASPTPRIGGACVMAGLVTTGAVLVPLEMRLDVQQMALLLIAALPAFAGGFSEDVTKSVGVASRLGLTMVAAGIGALLFDATLARIDIRVIDPLFAYAPLGIAFTIFAVAGVANSVNIIDGYNGLAGGYSIIVLIGLAIVGGVVGDHFILMASLTMAGAIAGFLLWNYPRGRIFLGDGGAYLVGFWIAELAVMLVTRNPKVSPWCPLLMLAYPIFETIFSIYRRKLVRGHHPGHPDALHMHQLIYMRFTRACIGSGDVDGLTRRNSLVALYIWPTSFFLMTVSVSFWDNTPMLIASAMAFCGLYVWLYSRVVRWRAPQWLRMRRRLS